MGVSQIYRKTGEGAVASYDYTDIAEGTGVVEYNGFNSAVSGAVTYRLSGLTFSSDDIESNFSSTTATYNFLLSPFNLPKTAKGNAILRFSSALDTSAGGAGTLDFSATLYKVSNAVDTSLGSITFPRVTRTLAGKSMQNQTTVISIAQTHFKKDDYIKLSITGVSAGGIGYIGHDPDNRNGTGITVAATTPTKLQLFIPFKLDI